MTDPVFYPDPFRLRVHKALTACLEGVHQRDPKTGQVLDDTFVNRVFRGRTEFGDDDPVPMICILEPPLPIDQFESNETNPKSQGQWDLLIQGFVADNRDNPTDPAHFALADVKQALAIEKARRLPNSAGMGDPFGMGRGQTINGKTLGNSVTAIQTIGAGVVRPPEVGVSNKAYFWLTLTLKIAEDISQPFV